MRVRLRDRYLRFENRAFEWIGRAERYVRGLPPTVRMVPGTLERRLFRIGVGAMTAMLGAMLLPWRGVRVRVLLLVLLALFVLVMAVAWRDVNPGRRR